MVSARTAILQALRQGPGYGRQLIRRVDAATQGLVAIAPGSVYPTLRALERPASSEPGTVIPGRSRGGRARRYHELTVAGGREAEREGTALAGIFLAGRAESHVFPAERAAMRARVERVAEVYRFATEMRESLARARPRVSAPRRRRADLASAAVRLARLLGSDECVLIGGACGGHRVS